MKRLVVVVVIGLGAMFLAAPAAASGDCQSIGQTLSCSGTTEGRYVSGSYVPGHFGFDGGWIEPYWQPGYWESGYFYAFSCNHFGRTWSCTQTEPSYATWTVDD